MAMHKKSKGMARGGKSMMSKGYARGGTKARRGTSKIRKVTRKMNDPRMSDQDKSLAIMKAKGTKARMGKTKMAAKGGKMTLAKLRKIAGEMNYTLVKKK